MRKCFFKWIMKNSSALNILKCPQLLVPNCSTTVDSGSGKQGITKRVKQEGIAISLFPSSHQHEKNTSASDQTPQYIPTKHPRTATSHFKKVRSYWERKKSVQRSIQFLNMSIDFIKIFYVWHFMRFDILEKAEFYPKNGRNLVSWHKSSCL